MIAEIPALLVDFAWWLAFFGVLFGATWLTPVRRAVKWIFRRLVSEPVMAAFRKVVREESDLALVPLTERFDAHESYVRHHLGPNGSTTPIHERLTTVEDAVTKQR